MIKTLVAQAFRPAVATASLVAIVFGAAPRGQQSPIMSALQDELKRSMTDLRIGGEPAPYYIEYEIDDTTSLRTVARFGALIDETNDHSRTLRVQVRVGDYGFDSSRFITQDRGAGVVPVLADGGLSATLDDDYDVMRREIWLMTDAAYKRALTVFAKKKAAFQNRAAADALPDFSREKPVQMTLPSSMPLPASHEWANRVTELSAALMAVRGDRPLETAEAWASAVTGASYYVNSEGTTAVTPIESAYLRVLADRQGDDGITVRDAFTSVESRLEEMQPMAALVERARAVALSVHAQSTAASGEEFTGPVLLQGEASAEFLRQTLAPLFLARRPADSENPRFGGGNQQVTPFLTRIGLRVLSDSFTVSDTPSLKTFEGRPVAGAYALDDEAVAAEDVALVDKGRLVTLLAGRTPQRKLPQSNGHSRGGGPQAGVLQISSSQAVPASELKAKYIALLRQQDLPFGYIVTAVAAPGDAAGAGPGGPIIFEAVKVTPDGRETPVRGLRFGNVPSTAFRDILDASRERTLYNYRVNQATGASIIAPDLILEEVEVQHVRDVPQKPIVVPPPPAVAAK